MPIHSKNNELKNYGCNGAIKAHVMCGCDVTSQVETKPSRYKEIVDSKPKQFAESKSVTYDDIYVAEVISCFKQFYYSLNEAHQISSFQIFLRILFSLSSKLDAILFDRYIAFLSFRFGVFGSPMDCQFRFFAKDFCANAIVFGCNSCFLQLSVVLVLFMPLKELIIMLLFSR